MQQTGQSYDSMRQGPGYGTGYENVPARKTAEAAGFTLTSYLYWIEIGAEERWNLPAPFNRKLDTATSG